MVLSYVVGASSVSKAWSANLDTLIGCKLRELTVTYMPYIGVEGLEGKSFGWLSSNELKMIMFTQIWTNKFSSLKSIS